MAKPLLTALAASGPPTQHFPPVPDDALGPIPGSHRRAEPPALPALDESTLRAHFAELATVAETLLARAQEANRPAAAAEETDAQPAR